MKTYYDIAVIGGGVAGVAAAVQAARCGMKTVLVERTALVGGLATGGLINVFLPLCDGNGHQVTFGIAEEMLRKSIVYGPGEIPPNWKKERNGMERKRFIAVFSPASFVLALDEMLDEAALMSGWIHLSVTFASKTKWLRGLKSKTKAGVSNSVRSVSSMPAEVRFWRAASGRMS